MDQLTFPYTRCKFGVAVRDMTPPVGIYHTAWGAATHDRAEGIHRPLTATAAVFAPIAGDGRPQALVAIDHGWFQNPDDERAMRANILERTGLGDSELLINMSHTHASTNANSYLTDRPGGEFVLEHLAYMTKQIGDAILAAMENLTPVWIAYGYGHSALAFNRDYWDVRESRYVCGFNPAGGSDDTMLVARVTDETGKTLATMVNYSCHPTTLAWQNKMLSPDFVGATREIMEKSFDAPAIFLQGAQGETAPREQYTGDTAVADRNGRILGHDAAAAIEALPPAATKFVYTGMVPSGAPLGTWAYKPATADELQGSETLTNTSRIVDLKRKEMPTAEDLEPLYHAETRRREKEILLRKMLFQKALGPDPVHHMPLYAWRLGQIGVIAVPDELYSRFQVELRKHMGETPVMVLGVTNGTLGYMPPQEFYEGSRYQVWQSAFAPGCLEQVTAAAKQELTELFQK
ncbi:MAG: neutral/alkaline non-lysosomal ceramidase N-terminal domain-containing protein [Anaerolineae bacterium]|nr:neutral/alkaline non-lysosomal ceramidase N-terminal domain-containing protein [Anaerolineae bacterium]